MNDDEAHESICRRCGTCCMLSLRVNGRPVAIADLACPHLAQGPGGTRTCAVYERRFDEAPWCLPVEKARREGVLDPACPYRSPADPEGPQRLSPALARRLAPAILEALRRGPAPAWLDLRRVERLANP